jgi:symplekin
MERAVLEEKQRKASAESKKRPLLPSDEQGSDPKRVKLESESTSSANSASFLAAFDFTSLPSSLITELIVANIEAFTEPALIALVQTYRQNRGGPSNASASSPEAQSTNPTADRSSATPPLVKDEPPDPLQMDVDEEEIEYEPDRINMAVGFSSIFMLTTSLLIVCLSAVRGQRR